VGKGIGMDVATGAGPASVAAGVGAGAEGSGVAEGSPGDGTNPGAVEDPPQAPAGSSRHTTNARHQTLRIVSWLRPTFINHTPVVYSVSGSQ
jgi:hypothetical protein